ncbi:MAG: hypothetical protein P4M14_13320 [Gammaproteobacteria bacterium]|nr:hypothetical protein [Gammaproteobacteria bacterium]
MNNRHTLNIGGILCLAVTVYFIYYLLIKDKLLPSCVSSLLSISAKHWHLLGVALVPIYMGLMIFGAAMISLHFGSAIQRWLSHFWQN